MKHLFKNTVYEQHPTKYLNILIVFIISQYSGVFANICILQHQIYHFAF